jgi:hypothetical protein
MIFCHPVFLDTPAIDTPVKNNSNQWLSADRITDDIDCLEKGI